MAKPELDFTLEDVVRELGAENDAEGVTVEAICAKVGMSPNWVRKRIKAAIQAGRMEFAGRRHGQGIDGRTYLKPVYRILQ